MLGTHFYIANYCQITAQILAQLPFETINELADDVYSAWNNQRTIFLCGNGGSAANASHVGEDLAKSTLDEGDLLSDQAKRLKVISLTDQTAAILAWANDEGFEQIFVQQLKGLAREKDVLISFSGSGNSSNVLKAIEWANSAGLITWGLTGHHGGKLRKLAQHVLRIPLNDMGVIESIHLLLMHWVIDDVYGRIHWQGRYAQPETANAAG